MDIALNRKRPPEWSAPPTQVQECGHSCWGITALPRELVVKILTHLDGKDLVVCKQVSRAWKGVVESTPLLSRAFYRRMHPLAPELALPPGIHSDYSSIRNWLECFSERGRQLVLELDERIADGAPLLPERLFFFLARLLAQAPVLQWKKACTIEHTDWINTAKFHPDRRYLVTASNDKTAKICQHIAGQWQEIATLAHPDKVLSADFRPMGSCVTYCSNQTMQIWKGREVAGSWESHVTLPHQCLSYSPTSFSAHGDYLVTSPTWNTTQIHQCVNGQWQRQTTILDGYPVDRVCFHPQDNILVTVHNSANVSIWQLVDNRWNNEFQFRHPTDVYHIDFSPDGNRFLVMSEKPVPSQYITRVYIYNRAGGAWHQEATISSERKVETTRFSPRGDKLITVLEYGVTIWQCSDNSWQNVILEQDTNFINARFSPDGNRLVTTTAYNIVTLWKQLEGQWRQEATLHLGGECKNTVEDSCFSPYGHHLAIISKQQGVTLFGIVDGTWQAKSGPSLGRVLGGTFSPDGLYFLACHRCSVDIWTFQQEQR